MKEGKPLAKHLCFMIRLDPESLSCVKRSETFLEFAQDIFVHGITSSNRLDLSGEIRLCQTLQSIPFEQKTCLFYRTTQLICPPGTNGGRNEPFSTTPHERTSRHNPGTLGT